MKLTIAVEQYTETRRASGVRMRSAEPILRAFCRVTGEIEFEDVSQDLVAQFINRDGICNSTRASNFGAMKCFIEHYERRGIRMPFRLGPAPKPGPRIPPMILSPGQMKSLLTCIDRSHDSRCIILAPTFRQILLTLYATGARITEILRLKRRDVCLRRQRLTLQHNDETPARTIAFPKALLPSLQAYLDEHPGKGNSLVFTDVFGRPVSQPRMIETLKRLTRRANLKLIRRKQQLRFQDIRFTFAVHRITQAVRNGERLDDLLPALSTYMGYATLTRAEEFLAFVPERFRKDLEKLSPSHGWNKTTRRSGTSAAA